MSALARQLSAAQRQYDSESPDESGEAEAERAAEIVDGWMADPVKVAEALDDMAGTSDLNASGNSEFGAAIAELLACTGDEVLVHAERLREQVRTYFQRDAQTQAWAEAERERQLADEARWAA